MRNEKFDNIILIGLIFITAMIIALHHFSLNHALVIDTKSHFPVEIITDSSVNGKSTATLTKTDDYFLLDCNIVKSDYRWPFCEITFSFAKDTNGHNTAPIDLSTYEKVKVSAQYLKKDEKSHDAVAIRFQLRTFNPVYSTIQEQESWKYNGVEYWPEKNYYPVEIPMKSLQVSTWWLLEREIPIEHSMPEFDQVMGLEIATGNSIPPGYYQLKIEKIEFFGKIYSNKQVYSFVIAMWVMAAIFGLFVNLQRSKEKLYRARQRTQELKQLNQLLNVESKALKNQAERDPLTGALNRNGIEAIFTNEIEDLSLMFIDIDHFKPINDNYGHAIGDEILIAFVKLISENSRSTDFLARWGGEEFLLICPNTKLKEATELAESFRNLLMNHQWVNEIKLTASFGVAQKTKESVTDFIERADKALYSAKAQGRNRVVTSKRTPIDSSINF